MVHERRLTNPPAESGELSIMDLFLRDVREVALLTKDEEVSLFRRVEVGKRAARKISSANGNLLQEERDSLSGLIADGNAARDHVFRANLRLVIKMAVKYGSYQVELLDSIQVGSLGLSRAIEGYDHKRGNKFSTYATWWIRNGIQRNNANFGRFIRIPTHTLSRLGEILEIFEKYRLQFGRRPTAQELSLATSLKAKTIKDLLVSSRPPLSLDKPFGEENEFSLGDFVTADERYTPHQETDRNLLAQQLEKLLVRLTPRQEKIIRMRFGLDGGGERTLEEIADKMELSRERVRQIQRTALDKIRAKAHLLGLNEFLFR